MRNEFAGRSLEDACAAALARERNRRRAFELKRLQVRLEFRAFEPAAPTGSLDIEALASSGSVLFVGEGNLSFARSLIEAGALSPPQVFATVYEWEFEASDFALENYEALKALGATVLTGVDAANLQFRIDPYARFALIIFQFPNVASRKPIEGRNPNFILVRDFLLDAGQFLNERGSVLITTVDSSHYRGAFQLPEAAGCSGFTIADVFEFNPNSFPGYAHTMTHRDGGALESHEDFRTWRLVPR